MNVDLVASFTGRTIPAKARLGAISAAVLLTTIPYGAAQAAWSSDPGVQLQICSSGPQPSPVVVTDGAGGAIAIWQNGGDIFAQRVNLEGTLQWVGNGVTLCAAPGAQTEAQVVSDDSGGAIVVWEDFRNGAASDIFAQRVDASGAPKWTTNGVAICTAAGNQTLPAIVSDGAGGAIVTWQDNRAGFYADVYAQRVDASGAPMWTAGGVVLCNAASNQLNPSIVADGASGAIVSWQDLRSGVDWDIYAQRVDSTGSPQWTPNGVPLCAAADNQYGPRIASDGAGGAIIAWYDLRGGSDYDIYAQRVDVMGVPQWSADGVALCGAPFDQVAPVLISDDAGGAIVTWHDERGGAYAQRVSATGVPQWNVDGEVLCTNVSGAINPTIATDGVGGAIVMWGRDVRPLLHSPRFDIRAQRLNSTGTIQWGSDGVALCTDLLALPLPIITSNDASGAIVVYSGKDGGAFAQNVNADGSLGGTLLSAPPPSVTEHFALRSVQPNPSVGDLRVSFSLLDDSPATLELYDLTGRRLVSLAVGGLGPGVHATSLTSRVPVLPSGIYCVSLTQGTRHAFGKAVIVR